MTPFHLSAESGHIKIVNCLYDQRADINIQDDNGVITVDYSGRIKLMMMFGLASLPDKCCTCITFSGV